MLIFKKIRRPFSDISSKVKYYKNWTPTDIYSYYKLTREINPNIIDPNEYLSNRSKTAIIKILKNKLSPVQFFCIISDIDQNSKYDPTNLEECKEYADDTLNKLRNIDMDLERVNSYFYIVDKDILVGSFINDEAPIENFYLMDYKKKIQPYLNNKDYDHAFLELHRMALEGKSKSWHYTIVWLLFFATFGYYIYNNLIKAKLANQIKNNINIFTKILNNKREYEKFITERCVFCFEPITNSPLGDKSINIATINNDNVCTHKYHRSCISAPYIEIDACIFCKKKNLNLFNRGSILQYMIHIQSARAKLYFTDKEIEDILNNTYLNMFQKISKRIFASDSKSNDKK